jgi:citrate lyase subunit beta/citryl-CoA lyase
MLLRSCLFVPGNNYRAILKTEKIDFDAAIFDLEDAVPPQEKETARIFVRDAIEKLDFRSRLKIVRINSEAELMEGDLKAVLHGNLDGIMLPKVEDAKDVTRLRRLVEKLSDTKSSSPFIVALIESARGVVKAEEIAESEVAAIAFGALDYYRTLGRSYFKFSAEQTELLYARSRIANAAKAFGKKAIDSPFFGLIIDKERLIAEAKMAWQLGFDGKLVIHPNHVGVVNEIFSPSEEDVRLAKEIVENFEKSGTTSVGGRMIDHASYVQAKDVIEMYEEILRREKEVER